MKENVKTIRDETHKNESVKASPSKKRTIIFYVSLFLFLLFCAWAAWMRINNPNLTLWALLRQGIRLPTLMKKSVLKTREPKLLTDKKVEKKISAKDGGELELTSDNGYTYRIVVAPGVLNQDTTIGLTPLEEAPFTYPSAGSGQVPPDPNNPDPNAPPDPGVDVTVDPPQEPPDGPPPPNPPEPPDEPPLDPTDGNTGVELYIFPPGFGRLTMQTGGDATQQAADIMASLGLGNMSMLISPTDEPAKPEKPAPAAGTGTGKTPDVIVLIPRDGRPRIRIPSPVWANNGHKDPPDGGGTDVPEGGGTATPDGTENGKGEDQVDQAKENSGGRCSPEFINAVANVYGSAGLEGQTDATNRYAGLMKECEEEIIGYLKRLCQSDRRLLRRIDFTTARKLLGLARATPEKFEEVTKLEKECHGYYTITGSDSPEGSGTAGVSITGTIDAHVCGYFDDLWEGKTGYTLVAEGGSHVYEGTTSFRLPARGGRLNEQDISSSQAAEIGGTPLSIQVPNLGFTGRFDSRYTVTLLLYPAVKVKIEILLVSTDCTESPIYIPPVPLTL